MTYHKEGSSSRCKAKPFSDFFQVNSSKWVSINKILKMSWLSWVGSSFKHQMHFLIDIEIEKISRKIMYVCPLHFKIKSLNLLHWTDHKGGSSSRRKTDPFADYFQVNSSKWVSINSTLIMRGSVGWTLRVDIKCTF